MAKTETPLTRTRTEVKTYILEHTDPFGFTTGALLNYLTFDLARDLMRDDYVDAVESGEKTWDTPPNPNTPGGWMPSWAGDHLGTPRPMTREAVLLEASVYHVFACQKAIDQRGISASRSVMKLAAWAWLLGEDELVKFAMDDDNYPDYGAPVLKRFAEHFSWPWPDSEALEVMAAGNPR